MMIYSFSYSGHHSWKARLSDIVLKENHPRTLLAKFGKVGPMVSEEMLKVDISILSNGGHS